MVAQAEARIMSFSQQSQLGQLATVAIAATAAGGPLGGGLLAPDTARGPLGGGLLAAVQDPLFRLPNKRTLPWTTTEVEPTKRVSTKVPYDHAKAKWGSIHAPIDKPLGHAEIEKLSKPHIRMLPHINLIKRVNDGREEIMCPMQCKDRSWCDLWFESENDLLFHLAVKITMPKQSNKTCTFCETSFKDDSNKTMMMKAKKHLER
jgi:hypothetical protein